MVVQLPVMAISMGLKALQAQADARKQEISLAHQRQTSVQKHQMDLVRLKIETESLDRQRSREAAVLTKMIDMSGKLFEWKKDAILEIFHGVKDILVQEQKILSDEKFSLTQALLGGGKPDRVQFVLIQKRQRELDQSLADIREAALQLGDTAFSVISAIEPALPPQTRAQIENLRS